MIPLVVLMLDVNPSDEMFPVLSLSAPLAVWVIRVPRLMCSEWPKLRDVKTGTASRQPSAVSVTFPRVFGFYGEPSAQKDGVRG